MTGWTARVAPLGVEADDGRVLALDGNWTLPYPAPLHDEQGNHVGQVLQVMVADGWLTAAGEVEDPDIAAGMAGRELRPQLDLDAVTCEHVGDETLRFTAGRVAGIVAGRSPAFDGVWFELNSAAAA